MNELLSPAGTIEAFHAAISNGCNAIYLGLDRFSARAYANNFTLETLKPLLDFAHLRNVKIYVTVNTIVYDKELDDVYKTLDALAEMGVDGVIVQDLAVADYITSHYESLCAHASTQMGIDDLDAASLAKDMGFKRVVFARETPLSTIKDIKNKLGIEVEAFIHGALCVSYSGNCFMSSSIGERSGNRGRCAGCCRKYYSLIDLKNNKTLKDGYLLSMKDLNVSNNIKDMSFVDSLKIEGRMKEPNYVASVTNTYRRLLDNEIVEENCLDKVFNRTYTQGFMNGDTSAHITNIEKPNNYGYYIGNVTKQNKGTIWIRLNKELSKGDQIRIETENIKEEISVPVLKLFDNDFNEVDHTSKNAVLKCEKRVNIGSKVYKTKDANFVEQANKTLLKNEYAKIPIKMEFTARLNKPLFLKITYQTYNVYAKSNIVCESALTQATTKENIEKQLTKLNDTPYCLDKLDIALDDNCFIPLKAINELRREGIEKLNSIRVERNIVLSSRESIKPQKHELQDPEITVEVSTQEQYDAALNLGIHHIYFKNIIRRNNATYNDVEGEVLVCGLGGLKHYIKSNKVVTDYSLNIVNHKSAAILSSLGVERITLSNEMSKEQILDLISSYIKEFDTYPNLEFIVYGRSKIMHSKYCPLKRVGLCGECKKSSFALKDDFATFPIVFNDDCTTTLLNSKPLNIMDDINGLSGINYYRLSFSDETVEETINIIKSFQDKLDGIANRKLFKQDKHTRGHFNKPLI